MNIENRHSIGVELADCMCPKMSIAFVTSGNTHLLYIYTLKGIIEKGVFCVTRRVRIFSGGGVFDRRT